MANELEIIREDDATILLTVVDVNNATIELTGFTIKFTVKKYTSDASNIFQKTTAEATEIKMLDQDTNKGEAEVYIDSSDTTGLSGEYHYDVEVTTVTGKKKTIIKSRFTIKKDVTD